METNERSETCGGRSGSMITVALLMLAVATILISPMLFRLGTGYEVTESVERMQTERYTGDAGIEFGLWNVAHNPVLRETLVGAIGTPVPLVMPGSVNGLAPTVEVVCVSAFAAGSQSPDQTPTADPEATEEATEEPGDPDETPTPTPEPPPTTLQYAVWANSTSADQTLRLTGARALIVGDVHSNNEIEIAGAASKVQGKMEAVNDITISGAWFVLDPGPMETCQVADYPVSWDIADFAADANGQPQGAYAVAASGQGAYYVHTEEWNISAEDEVIPAGLHYCTNKVHISGANVTMANGGVTIVSTDEIQISGAGLDVSPYILGLSLFSSKTSTGDVVKISGAGNVGGTIFAPNGGIEMAGHGTFIEGAFIGDRVRITGSDQTIQLAEGIPLETGTPGGQGADYSGGSEFAIPDVPLHLLSGIISGEPTFDWGLWADSTARKGLELSGSGHTVMAAVHSNGDLKLNGSGHTIIGTTESVNAPQLAGTSHQILGPAVITDARSCPILWNLSDYAPGGSVAALAASEGMYHSYEGDWHISGSDEVIEPGLHYCSGKVTLSGARLVGEYVTIVTPDEINISGAGGTFSPYIQGLTFFANKTTKKVAFSMSGAGNTGGTVYAPNGGISLTGAGDTINGSFIGKEIKIAGSNMTIKGVLVYLERGGGPIPTSTPTPHPSPTPEPTATPDPLVPDLAAGDAIYDIRSRIGGTTVNVRVKRYADETLEVRSWHVD